MAIEFEGIEDINERFEKIGDLKKFEAALKKACALVERSAKKKAPKDTGELRRFIQSKIEVEDDTMNGVVFSPLKYAPYIEYGTGLFAEENGRKDVPWHYKDDKGEWHSTSGQKPQPFIRPALEENREEIIRILREATSSD